MAYFLPLTPRDMRMMFYCEAGNDANRGTEKFLHNSIQFPLNPNGKLLCQEGGRGQGTGGERETGDRGHRQVSTGREMSSILVCHS